MPKSVSLENDWQEQSPDVNEVSEEEYSGMADIGDLSQDLEASLFAIWMASSEVDQKYLGHLAAATSHDNSFLSSMLYKILGLSVILSKKLLRARKLRRLDPTRETKSLQLYHHIIWLAREGLVIVEQYILPMVQAYVELKVLAYKLRASFYHIFVLFHNQPAIHPPGIYSLPSSSTLRNAGLDREIGSAELNRASMSITPPPAEGGPVRGGSRAGPPGLAPVQPSRPAASFLLPALDYTSTATTCFSHAATLADTMLPGSHPLRLSVKLEYAAYLYDCLHDADACRRLAKQAITDVYHAQEGMDDESFEDAAELVGVLGRMVKRGGKTSSAGGSSTPARDQPHSNEGSRTGQNTPSRQVQTPTRSQTATPPSARTKQTTPTPTQTKKKTPPKKSPSTASATSSTPKAPPTKAPMVNPI